MDKIIIKPGNDKQRLDKFLALEIEKISRSQIKKLIKTGQILVNNKIVSPHYLLKESDEIIINQSAENKKEKLIEKIEKLPAELMPQIISENEYFLVINKPTGLLVHTTEKNEQDTLVNWLLARNPEIAKVGEEQNRAGIIHRLDRDVSGVMLVAKTNHAYFHLKQQFKERKIKKEYVALVYGKMEDKQGEINLPIGRSREGKFVAHPRRGKTKFQETDRTAKTIYWVKEYLGDYTLLKVQILTGRPHQIRAHLSAIGHPVIGDSLYKPRKKFLKFFSKKIKVIEPGWLFLYSKKIGFYDMENKWVEFEAPIPEKFISFLKKLKK